MAKPKAKLIGENGNVFNLIGICRKALTNAGKFDEAQEMQERIMLTAKSYEEALNIMGEYCDIE